MNRDGLYERKNAEGKRTAWIWDVMLDGERVVRTFDGKLSRSVAKELANVERTKIRLGQAGIKRKRDITIEDAFKLYYDYLEGEGRRANTRTFYECAFDSLTDSFAATRKLSTITTFPIEQHRLALVRAGRKRRQSADLQALRAVFRKAAELGRYNLAIPKIAVSLPKPTKTRVLSHDEEEVFLAELGEPHRTLSLVYFNLGLRRNEGLSLTWGDVDFENRLLTVRGDVAKSGRPRSLPMNSVLVEALLQHRDRSQHVEPGDRLFWNRRGAPLREVEDVFRRAFHRAGIDDCTPHTIRHTFASRLVTAGVDVKTVMELGGWTKLEMLQRYAHSGAEHKRRAVEMLAESGKKSPQISQQPKTQVRNFSKKTG